MYAAVETHTSGADTITLHLSGTTTNSYLTCFEAAGASDIVDTSTKNSATSATSPYAMTTASLTPRANDLVYAFSAYQACEGSSTPTYTSGFTSMTAHGTNWVGATSCHSGTAHYYENNAQDEYEIPSSATATTAGMGVSFTSSTTGTWGWAEIAADFEVDPVLAGSITLTPTDNQATSGTQSESLTLSSSLNQVLRLDNFVCVDRFSHLPLPYTQSFRRRYPH